MAYYKNLQWVNGFMLNERIDATYYNNEGINYEKKLLESNVKKVKMNEVASLITQGPNPIFINDNTKIPCLKTRNVYDEYITFEQCNYISCEEYEKYKKFNLHYGDILVSILGEGSIGKSNIYTYEKKALFNRPIGLIRLKDNVVDKFYVSIFLRSIYGKSFFERGISGSSGQKVLSIEYLKNIPLPIPSPEIQKYIGDKVRKAEELREEAKRFKKESEEILNNEILNMDNYEASSKKLKWVKSNSIFVERLEAEYYEDKYVYADKLIKKHEYRKLEDIILEIQDGPGGWSISTNDYVDMGVPIIRGINVGHDGEFVNDGFVYITEEKNKELKKTEVVPGQVLLTVRGSIGRATVMPDYIEKANLNAAVVRIKVKEEVVNPFYIAGFFNSTIGRLQTERIANGAVQLNMNLSECKSNLIPIPDMMLQNKYKDKFKEYLNVKIQSKQLITEAKQDVEDLIEGNFDMSKLNQS